jgi:uncharacterized protein with HEPN domain
MRDYALEAVELLGSRSLDELSADRKLQLALLRCIEVIGEASTRVEPSLKKQHAEIAWNEAASMRHKLIHEYTLIKIETVFDTVRNDLPPLISQLNDLLS